jgi:hypothetical protein
MFGMLDYRAHKLYLMLFGLPWFALRWIWIIGFPFIYYFIGLSFDVNRIFQILISLISMVILEFALTIAMRYLDRFIMFLFTLLIDVIPADGRTPEEAVAVVKSGDQAIRFLKNEKKHPKDWDDEYLMMYKSSIFSLPYRNKIDLRVRVIKNYFLENPGADSNEYAIKEIVRVSGLKISWLEWAITNAQIRGMVISYSLLVYLLLFNPFNK